MMVDQGRSRLFIMIMIGDGIRVQLFQLPKYTHVYAINKNMLHSLTTIHCFGCYSPTIIHIAGWVAAISTRHIVAANRELSLGRVPKGNMGDHLLEVSP